MTGDITPQSVLFPDQLRRPVVARFDQRHGSSDGGAILLKSCDDRLRLTERLMNCIVDTRQSGKIEHTIGELVRQRRFAIACGYPDGDDAARLGEDPIQKLMIGRDPIDGATLRTNSSGHSTVKRARPGYHSPSRADQAPKTVGQRSRYRIERLDRRG